VLDLKFAAFRAKPRANSDPKKHTRNMDLLGCSDDLTI
jgi:hypothetical protein